MSRELDGRRLSSERVDKRSHFGRGIRPVRQPGARGATCRALLRRREIADGLVDLLIQIVHRIGVRAEQRLKVRRFEA
ncbi:MAG: hypothetical protein P8Y27_02970 [Chromatiaceae bacterium]